MTYIKYGTKSTIQATSTARKDLVTIPFGDIEDSYQSTLKSLVKNELDRLNAVALEVHNKTLARVLASRNASSEENPDDAPDFIPIEHLDADTLKKYKASANEQSVLNFAEKHNIAGSWSWLAPQIIAYLGNYTIPTKVNGYIKCTDFLNLNVTSKFDLGIYRMFTKVPRGRLMKLQTDAKHIPVCSLVPIYMAAQKFSKNTKFSEWLKDDVHTIVDDDLYKAMVSPPLPGPYDANELLTIRNTGLRYISRAKKELGVTKSYNPVTYHMLTGVSDSLVGGLSKYAKAMLCQIWCAHPVNRTQYMILDPYNWDNIPEPLISDQIFNVPEVEVDIPWA